MFSATKFLIFSLCLCQSYDRIVGRGDIKLDPIPTSTIESTSTVTTEASTSAETTPEFVTRKRTTPTIVKPKTTTRPVPKTEDEIIDWMLKTLKTRPTTRTVRTTLTTRTTPTTATTVTTPLRTTRRTIPTTVTTPRTIPTTVTTPRTTPQTTQVYFPRYRSTVKTTTPDPFNEIYKDVYPYVWSFDQPKPLPPFYHDSILNNLPTEQGPIDHDERLNTPEVVPTTTRSTPKPVVIYQNERKYWVISNYRNSTKNHNNHVISYPDTMGEPQYQSHSYGAGPEPGLYYPPQEEEGWALDQTTKRPSFKMATTKIPPLPTIGYTRPRLTTVKASVRSGEYINMATPLYDAYQPPKAPIGINKFNQLIIPSSYPRIQPKIYESAPNPEENSYYQAVHPSMPSLKYYKYADPARNSN